MPNEAAQCNSLVGPSVHGDRKLAQTEAWNLILPGNDYDIFELVDEYVVLTVQNSCKGKYRSRDVKR